jgi:hypothetical protein
MKERLIESLKLAQLANGGAEFNKSFCQCDASVGMSPCQYCAIFFALKDAIEFLTDGEKCWMNDFEGFAVEWLKKMGYSGWTVKLTGGEVNEALPNIAIREQRLRHV